METIGVEGRTLKDAIEKACAELSIGEGQLRYKLDVEHFRDPFGKARGVDTVKIIAWADTAAPAAPAPAPRRAEPEERPAPRRSEAEAPARAPRARPEPQKEEAPAQAEEIEETQRVVATPALTGSTEEVVTAFVSGTLERMGIKANVKVETLEDRVQVSLNGVDSGDLDQGQVSRALKCIVYLANRIATEEREQAPRITLAVLDEEEEDRAEKEAHLEAVAAKVAAQVLKDGRALTLKPMNSYERRVIHLAISRHEGVGSRSIGDGQRKRIQVYPIGGDDQGGEE